ncbi:DUF4079 domain-containing protein [Geitlerinema sp. P-1104]|uniref:DUF4079 domain-containing protein n=1 Tax=Geitlerinema sp. P-1104 TaxID=2546230 RepID=UPI0014770112|nr:DUF4079 domain-containing protein [Geitlerinema sp. P-1104]NMG58060.1 DUF4079 domain-containing protein [Geitlerinema sp. P-1104]
MIPFDITLASALGEQVSDLLEPIAAQFRSLNIPAPITHWGHPVMMGIVAVAMGSATALTGWKGRLAEDKEESQKNRSIHSKISKFMAFFMMLGYTGGVLSLVMQQQPILESPHFWTGSMVVALLVLQSLTSFKGFWGTANLRLVHAYIGSSLMVLLVVHAILGIRLGLSI